MDREYKNINTLRKWQRMLNLQKWNLSIQYKKFERTDFLQSADIDVDSSTKSAVVYITDEDTTKDDYHILHELIHLLLWDYDHFSESRISDKEKDQYFDLLESTVESLTNILYAQK